MTRFDGPPHAEKREHKRLELEAILERFEEQVVEPYKELMRAFAESGFSRTQDKSDLEYVLLDRGGDERYIDQGGAYIERQFAHATLTYAVAAIHEAVQTGNSVRFLWDCTQPYGARIDSERLVHHPIIKPLTAFIQSLAAEAGIEIRQGVIIRPFPSDKNADRSGLRNPKSALSFLGNVSENSVFSQENNSEIRRTPAISQREVHTVVRNETQEGEDLHVITCNALMKGAKNVCYVKGFEGDRMAKPAKIAYANRDAILAGEGPSREIEDAPVVVDTEIPIHDPEALAQIQEFFSRVLDSAQAHVLKKFQDPRSQYFRRLQAILHRYIAPVDAERLISQAFERERRFAREVLKGYFYLAQHEKAIAVWDVRQNTLGRFIAGSAQLRLSAPLLFQFLHEMKEQGAHMPEVRLLHDKSRAGDAWAQRLAREALMEGVSQKEIINARSMKQDDADRLNAQGVCYVADASGVGQVTPSSRASREIASISAVLVEGERAILITDKADKAARFVRQDDDGVFRPLVPVVDLNGCIPSAEELRMASLLNELIDHEGITAESIRQHIAEQEHEGHQTKRRSSGNRVTPMT